MATTSTEKDVTGWVGWIYFAAFLMLIQGVFQSIEGLVALMNRSVIISGPTTIWLFNITTWGWVHTIMGIVLIVTGLSLFSGGLWGRVVGVVLTLLSAVINFTFLPIYPLWSLVILALNALVLYALIAHGAEAGA